MYPTVIKLSRYHKKIDEICETAKKIARRMYEEIENHYDTLVGFEKKSDYELCLEFFGNEILIEVEIPLFENKFEGIISCRRRNPEDNDSWIKLSTSFKYDSLGNINNDNDSFNAYEVAHELVKDVLDELKREKVNVKIKEAAQ